MVARDIDHVVICVRDLGAAKAAWEALGFTTTPRAVHPFGTANSLIQLGGNFVELLEIDDPSKIQESTETFFGFAAHNRDFLADRGEGLSMLVLTSADRDADQDAWAAAGLRTYEPFNFERKARQPDGSETRVAFRLAFSGHPALSGLGFFVCQQETPETFWKPDYQRHANTATRINAVTIETPDPAAAGQFLATASGGQIDPHGVALRHDRLTLRPSSSAAAKPAIPVLEIAVADLQRAATMPGLTRDGDGLVTAAAATHGVEVRLVQAA
jgi:hypothetical protein